MRSSASIFLSAASAVARSGQTIQEKTTLSPSLACTARRKSVTLPSRTSSPQASMISRAPRSRNIPAASAAILR